MISSGLKFLALRLFIFGVVYLGCFNVAYSNPLAMPISEEAVEEAMQEGLPQEVYIEITADEVNYDQEADYYEAAGSAEAFIPSKNATLYADKIIFTGESRLVEALGDVKMVQGDNTITGTYSSFNIDANTNLTADPKIFVKGLRLKARVADTYFADNKVKKQKSTIQVKDGIAALDQPISIFVAGNPTLTRYSSEINRLYRSRQPGWEDLPEKASFKYSAKEITYDDTKKINNLKIKGARLWISDKLSIPAPVHITTTVGEYGDTKFMGPIVGQSTRIGGFDLGPRFYYARDIGTFSLVPVAQLGNGPSFGGGMIGSFNTPGDKTAIMGGYGSLNDRFVLNAHQDLTHGFEANLLKNQFVTGIAFGASQVGEFGEIAHNFKLRLPFIDERGMRVHNSAGFAKDNPALFSSRRLRDLLQARTEEGDESIDGRTFRSEHNISSYTVPIFRFGNELYNATLRGRTDGSLRFYGTGDILGIARYGPAIQARIDNVAFELGYLFAFVGGQSPFLFDQFIDGDQSVVLDGDYKVNKWVSVGTFLNYNVSRERFSRNQLRTEFGPKDFKLRLSYDTILNQINFGFNMIFGEPVKFDTLNVKFN